MASVVGETGDAEVGEQELPKVVAPENFEAKEGFIALVAPELSAPLHPALHLSASRFDGSRAHRFAAFLARDILHSLLIAAVVINGGIGDLG